MLSLSCGDFESGVQEALPLQAVSGVGQQECQEVPLGSIPTRGVVVRKEF